MTTESHSTQNAGKVSDDASAEKLKDVQHTSRFKKDFKRMKDRGADVSLLKEVIVALRKGVELEAKFKNHRMEGRWKESYDCHIQPDWVLIYRITDGSVILQAMGTHSDLFKK